MRKSDIYHAKRQGFEKTVTVNVDGRKVKDLISALQVLVDTIKDIDGSFIEDIHTFNHDDSGAHLSLDYVLEPDVAPSQPAEIKNDLNTEIGDESGLIMHVWRYSNVCTPSDAAVAISEIIKDLLNIKSAYYLDMTSSSAVGSNATFCLEIRLYAAKHKVNI